MAHVTAAILTVPNIACGRCERTVGDVLAGLTGVRGVNVNAAAQQVEIAYDEAATSVERMQEVLEAEGYAVAGVRLRLRRPAYETTEKERDDFSAGPPSRGGYPKHSDQEEMAMATIVLKAPDISCGHCERVITQALTPVEGIRRVTVSIPEQQIRVEYDPALIDLERMKAILAAEDYPVASVVQQPSEDRPTTATDAGPGCACCSPQQDARPAGAPSTRQ